MNREIKFRAWGKESEKMYRCVDVPCSNPREWPILVYTSKNIISGLDEPYELMQFTGFKDKNGKEIYEGDILYLESHWPIRIEFEKGCFMVQGHDEVQYINKVIDTPISKFAINQYAVIGNIYQGIGMELK